MAKFFFENIEKLFEEMGLKFWLFANFHTLPNFLEWKDIKF